MVWKDLCMFETKYPADSVEWCPFQDYFDYFLCGTYYLLEGVVQERIGLIYLIKFENENVTIVQEIESDGILDMKWCRGLIGGMMLVATGTSKGDLRVLKFSGDAITPISTINLKNDDGEFMILAVNWFKVSENFGKICVSDNKGGCGVVSFIDGQLSLLEKWNAHDLEVWTIAFDYENSDIVYTGGDDAKLKIWDKRTSAVKTLSCQDTGVTIIETDTGKPFQLISGSFDEIVHFWDTRQMQRPIFSVKGSGGLWRIKTRGDFVLTANIYGGFQIIDSKCYKVVVTIRENNTNLAYGADWSRHADYYHIGTCSFYDKTLFVSTWEF